MRKEKGDEGERGGTGFNEQKAKRREGEVKHGVAQKSGIVLKECHQVQKCKFD